MAQTTSLVFNGGVIPSPSPVPSGSGKAKLLKIGKITVTEQEVQVTKSVICDPDSVTTVAPFMEVLTSARLAELISANNILVLDDGTMQYLMSDATISVEDGTSVCTAVNFLGLSKESRAKVLYPCTRLIDEMTLQQVLEVGEPAETGFDLVKAYPEDTDAGTLIDKLEIEDTIQEPEEQTLLKVVPTDGKVAINEDRLRETIDGIDNTLDSIIETIDELDVDSVPHAYLHSTLAQSAGDSVTTGTSVNVFAQDALEGDCFEFEQTTTIDDTPFGYVWIEPGTYLINASVTLQWVGNPRGTFIAKVGSVMGENFDFSQEQEISRQSTKVVTIPNRMKLAVNVTYDKETPVIGFWIKSMQVVKLAGGMSQTTVAHGLSLEGNGSVEDPLDISDHGLRETFEYARNADYFATKQETARLATWSALQTETARATQRENEIEALFVLPTQEAVDAWLAAHPEATTTVEDDSITDIKLHPSIKFNREESLTHLGYRLVSSSVPLSSQLIYSNTIYEIRWDFDITGETIAIPSGCILKFSGGRVKGGTLIGNRTSIESSGFCLDGVKLKGTFTNPYFSVDWFGVEGDGVTDVTTILRTVINNIEPNIGDTKCSFTLFFSSGIYCISSEIRLKSFIRIKGCGKNINTNNGSGSTFKLTASDTAIFRIDGTSRDIRIEDINFECFGSDTWHQDTIAIKAQPMQEADGAGSSKPTSIINCAFMGFSRHISIERGLKSDGSMKSSNDWQFDNVTISNCSFYYAFEACIYCETSNGLDYSIIEKSNMSLYGDGTEKYCIKLVRSGFLRISSCAFWAVGTLTGTGIIDKYEYTGPIVMDSVHGESIDTYGKANGRFSINNSVIDHEIELTSVTGTFYCNTYDATPSIVLKNDCKIFTDAARTKIKIEGLNNTISGIVTSSRGLVDADDNPLFFPICKQKKTLVSTGPEESVEIFRGAAKRYSACAYKVTLKAEITTNLGGGSYKLVFNPNTSGAQTLVSPQTTESEQTFVGIINDSLSWSTAVLTLFCTNCTVRYSIIVEQLSANTF